MISIIIPILNEAKTIEKLLFHLIDHSSLEHISEIIIVDGGSTDGSLDIIKRLDLKIKLVSSPKGRAKQMNLGAKHATGSILYFLHADSFPPLHFDDLIISEVKKGNNAGCFRMQFESNHWWLRLMSWFTQFSWRASRGGDQSQFITRALFDDIGGYDENYIIYEDNMLINELYARNEFVVINKKLKTSARRYQKHGVWTLQYHFCIIYIKKWFGASANDMLTYYKKHIC
ncbi:TIGR04283 family arsenosugar biosynthesis glycosyltransferase [Psychroserpens damuponensis]|uniref:TIGR04283 family arsenosugar biosynthesis glycosyltransferase n=1 Tax=Psychroserpens damuponensis TaxID=943936 RepID=UPI00058D615A|nr:TIGR04283 family arsenosugar biosynthesis glycosyltransferase [Psychroserpens damuponensis]